MNMTQEPQVTIRLLEASDIPDIVASFAEHDWPKPVVLFEKYLQEKKHGERVIWVAYLKEQFVGYVTLKWQSKYDSFRIHNISEIIDLNVLPPYRKLGVGSKLLETAESLAATRSDVIGIGVGLYGDIESGYGAAQQLYVKRGYVPDGLGLTYDYQRVAFDQKVPLNDDLILWFTQKLR